MFGSDTMAEARSMPQLVIVTPALRDANNGNWQTAQRWQRHLRDRYAVRIVRQWPSALACDDAAMIALHARRSADSIAAWAARHPQRGLAVVLTGTDLYRDIAVDASAQRALQLARTLVVLQEAAPAALAPELRGKCRLIYQSTTPRKTLPKSARSLHAVMVGHLREEKSPETLFAAARLLAGDADIYIDHVGEALDPALGRAAQATMAAVPNYRWLGGLPHEETRRRIQRAHLLIHCSRMEGGAHVIMEATASGTPVLASRIDGNVGMLGADYAGYFSWGDAEALAALILRCQESSRKDAARPRSRDGDDLLETLQAQCAARAPLFAPEAERAALHGLARDLLVPR
jgi:putative glycosyltransferase (TIGR04348 family)